MDEKKRGTVCDCGHPISHHTAAGWCDVCQGVCHLRGVI